MARTSTLGLVLLAAAAVLAGLGAQFQASSSAAEAACAADDSCYVAGIGDGILAARLFLWAGFVGVAGVATVAYALLRPRRSPPPSPPS